MKTAEEIIESKTFVKDGLITVELAAICAKEYASQFTPSTKEEKTGGEVEEEIRKECVISEIIADRPERHPKETAGLIVKYLSSIKPSIPLTDTDNYEVEAENLLIKHLTPIYGEGESTIMAKLEKNKCIISAIVEARKMSLPNKKSAKQADKYFFAQGRHSKLNFAEVKEKWDKVMPVSSLPETDKMGELIKYIEKYQPNSTILSKAKELQSK